MIVQELIDQLSALTPRQKKLPVVYGCDETLTGEVIKDIYEGKDYGSHPVIRLNKLNQRYLDGYDKEKNGRNYEENLRIGGWDN